MSLFPIHVMKMIERENGKWEVYEHFPFTPIKAYTFALDTETLTYLDGKIVPEKELREALDSKGLNEIKARVKVDVWAWQSYDEQNGFYMTNDFYLFLDHLCQCGYKFGWCYNAIFDFANVDYKLLGEAREQWKLIEKGKEKTYSKHQPWSYESIHSDMGARYGYKLWIPYRHWKTRHKMVHSVEFRDFKNFLAGGLRKILDDLKVTDNDGNPIRKLKMNYQNVKPIINELTDDELAYCRNDVAGLYFAIKQFNKTIEKRSGCDCHIFGKQTNLMTAGGFAKRQLLKSMYPDKTDYKKRLKKFQYDHPMSLAQDKWLREHGLYRGGITFVNPLYKGVMNERALYRYDVNSEYPYAMSEIQDLIGKGKRISYDEWCEMDDAERDHYECAYILEWVNGYIRKGMLGVWYDPKRKDFVTKVDEHFRHVIWEREFFEMNEWYDLEFGCDWVLIWKRGNKAYAPFVLQNYANKSEAKNESEKKEAKLELNSSYGKLSERSERERGHYEKDSENDCIHFVRDGVDVDASSMMSVAVGSLITSFARCYILGKIREICPVPARDFVYIDTDSIHCFCKYDGCDPKRLGALKLEAVCPYSKYIAPKTYIDIEALAPFDPLAEKPKVPFEVHSKGINTNSIVLQIFQDFLANGKVLTIDILSRRMEYGAKYPVLQAVNVTGGKALIPTSKYLCKPLSKDDKNLSITNLDGTMLVEA
jgi:hypothetical protein